MKKIYSKMAVTAALLSLVSGASAQGLRSAYFSDSYLYRHQMNPALGNEDAYFSLPVLGNVSLNAGLGVGISTLVPSRNGKLVTFMHESVDAGSFLKELNDENRITQNLDMQVFSLGFTAFGGYNTIDLGVHQTAGVNLPKGLFAFMKEMNPGRTYNFSDVQVSARAYTDLALGHSHKVNDHLRVGGKLHLLFGSVYANAKLDNCTATFSADEWRMKLNGTFDMACGDSYFKTKEDQKFDGMEMKTDGLASSTFSNFGMALDLGATYDMAGVVDGLRFSTSINDLGWIGWGDCNYAYNDGQEFSFRGFNNLSMHSGEGQGTIDEQWSDIRDDLEAMYNLRVGKRRAVTEALAATLTIGAEYELQTYKPISFGLLYTQRFSDIYGYEEGRAVVNFAPSKIFDMAVSACASTYGFGMGASLNLHVTGFNLFLGTDNMFFGRINKDFIPLEQCAANVQFGINFPLSTK